MARALGASHCVVDCVHERSVVFAVGELRNCSVLNVVAVFPQSNSFEHAGEVLGGGDCRGRKPSQIWCVVRLLRAVRPCYIF